VNLQDGGAHERHELLAKPVVDRRRDREDSKEILLHVTLSFRGWRPGRRAYCGRPEESTLHRRMPLEEDQPEPAARGGRREHPHRDLDPDTRGCQECRRRIRPSSGADDVELTAVQRVEWIVDDCLETSGIVAVVGFTRTFTSL